VLIRPLVSRELLRECRHGTHFLGRGLLVTVLALFVAWRWLQFRAYGGELPQAAMARHGTWLLIGWATLQYIAVWAFSTIRAAALADERRLGSLPLMRTTALLDGGVILGWFVSVMGRALFTMALALPMLVISRSFGGFTMVQIGLILLVTILSAATIAAFTLCVAATSGSTGSAVLASVIIQALALTSVFIIEDQLGGMQLRWFEGPAMLSNVIAGWAPSWKYVAGFVGVRLLLVGFWLVMATAFLKRPPLRAGQPLKRVLKAADRFFVRLSPKWLILWRGGLGECKGNPILWRERAVSVLGQRDHLIRMFYWPLAVLTGAVLVLLLSGLTGPAMGVAVLGLVGVPLLIFGILLIVPPAMAFVRERQQETLGSLAVTPLSARQIVLGKYLFSLRRLVVPSAIAGLVLGLMVAVEFKYGLSEIWKLLVVCAPLVIGALVVAEILYAAAGTRSAAKAIVAGAVLFGAALATSDPEVIEEISFDFVHDLFLPLSSTVAYTPAVVIAVMAAALAPRLRVMRNAVVLASLLFGPNLFMGLADMAGISQRSALLMLSLAATIATFVPLLAWGRGWWRLGWVALVFSLTGLLYILPFSWGFAVLWLALSLALIRILRYAGPGMVNRTLLVVMTHTVLVGGALGIGSWALIPVVALATCAFLVLTTWQLDKLIGRNG